MTNKQKQWQLYFLDYYGEDMRDLDGIFGEKSAAGTLAFQKDFFDDPIAHDGIFGANTEGKSQEVIDRIQDILIATVDGDLKDDGLAGPRTMEALKLYQQAKGLPQTGRVDDATWDVLMQEIPNLPDREPVPEVDTTTEESSATGTFWDGIKYFTREEFRCKCGGKYCNGFPAEPKEQLVKLLDAARGHFGRPAHIVSGLRCSTWNAIQGGVVNSQHIYGEAADVRIDGLSAEDLMAFFQNRTGVRYTYMINATNVHVDIPKGKR